VLFAALALSALSAALFLLVFNTPVLFVARLAAGFAAGWTATACTAWVAELAPESDHTLSATMATGANLLGLALGPLISGVLAQYEPAPLRLPYLVYLVGLVVPMLIVWTIHETVDEAKSLRAVSLRPRIGVPADIFGLFIAPSLTAFVSFALMGFYSSLIPSLILESLHICNHATNAPQSFLCSAAVSSRLPSRAVLAAGP
jgi:MFS family permease